MKKYRFFSALLAVAAAMSLLLPFSAQALEDPAPVCTHAILVDANYDEVLYEKSARDKAYPASITKVMTALLTIEAIEQGQLAVDTGVTIQSSALEGVYGSSANLKAGETMSVNDLLYCLLLPSANEAANVLAQAVDGDIAAFVEHMNRRARELGCQGTHFVNPHGLHDDDHYTTAYDIYLFLKEALKHDLFREIVHTDAYTTAKTNLSDPRVIYNTDGLVSRWHYAGYVYDKVIGGKTGTTDEAGKCLAVGAESGEDYLICVVLGSQVITLADGTQKQGQFTETTKLLKWGFDNFKRTTLSKGEAPVARVAVTLSQQADEVMLKPSGSVTRTLPKDLDLNQVESKITLFSQSVEAPVEEGQVMGTMTLSYEGEVYGTLDLVALTSVERSEFLYQKARIQSFFQHSGVQLILGAAALLAAIILLRLLVFRKRRRYRPTVGAGGRRSRYSGRRR